MKKFIAMIICIAAAFVLIGATAAKADVEGVSKIYDSIAVIEQIVSIPEKGIPPVLLRNASGIAIIPDVIKAGFVVGGRYGTGILVVRDKDGNWSNPSFITVAGGSVGWQIGVEAIDIVLVFKNERNINRILSGKFTLGADASVAAGPVGREAQAATDIQLKSEIYSYSRSRGLFAGLALAGSVLSIDEEDNAAFYGKDGILARDIFAHKDMKVPPVVEKLKRLLTDYAGK
jgi:lipid-binding SYLF domain-containing protein